MFPTSSVNIMLKSQVLGEVRQTITKGKIKILWWWMFFPF